MLKGQVEEQKEKLNECKIDEKKVKLLKENIEAKNKSKF